MAKSYEFDLEIDKYEDGTPTWLVTVPAFPEISTFGDNLEDAAHKAKGAIEEAIAARMHYGEEIPTPLDETPEKGFFVDMAAIVYLKCCLYEVCRKQGVTRAELARRMGKHRPQVDRLFDLNHNSQLEQFEEAAKALGISLSISYTDRDMADVA